MPLPHTTCITKPTQHLFFFFFQFFSHPHFLHLLYFSLISIFLHTHLHFVFFQVSTPLGQKSFNTSKLLLHQKGESEKDQNGKQRDLGKPKENEEQQRERERWLPVIDWRLDQSRANEREILHKGRFLYIPMFLSFSFRGILICKGQIFKFFFFPQLIWEFVIDYYYYYYFFFVLGFENLLLN